MATIKRRSRKPRQALMDDQIIHFILGWCLNTPVPWHNRLNFPFKDEEHRQRLWNLHKKEIMRRFSDGIPGLNLQKLKRPRAFDQYEGPKKEEKSAHGFDKAEKKMVVN